MTSASAAELGFVEEEGSEASSVSLAPDAILSSGFSGTGSGLGSRVVSVLAPASGDAVRSVPAVAIPAAAVPAAVSGVVLGEVSEAAGKVLGSGLSVASGFSLGMAPLASGGFPSIVSPSISSQGSEDALLRVSQRDLQRSARESDSGKAVVDSVKGLSAAGAEGLLSQNKEVLTTKPTFSPSLGAWAKPIQLSPDRAAGSLSRSDWPCLSTSPSNHAPRNKDQHSHKRGKVTVSTHQSLPSPLSDEDKKRFPWSAKMDQSVRNLYRATTPIYLEDGTPQVTIPSSVLLQGLENQKDYVLGQFYRCKTPSGGLVNAVVNRIWGKNCRISSRLAGISTYLFHIPDESTRSWVLRRGLWHVDDCMMFVAPWTPAGSLVIPEISTVPVWVTLKNIPYQLYSIPGVSHIASGLGAPMLTYKPRLDPLFMGEAKIMVEVELNKPFPHRVAAKDDCGTVNMVDVEYAWIPTKCGNCGQLGHKKSRCLDLHPINQASVSNTKELVSSTASTIPITVAPTRLESESTSRLDQAPTMAAVDNASVVPSPPPNATVFTCTPAAQIPPVTQTAGHKSVSISTASEPAIAYPITTALFAAVDAPASSTMSPEDFVSPHFIADTDNHGDSPRASELVYSSCEDTMDIHQLVEETLRRKSIRNIKPTLKAKELDRSANKSRRGKGRRGRTHR